MSTNYFFLFLFGVVMLLTAQKVYNRRRIAAIIRRVKMED